MLEWAPLYLVFLHAPAEELLEASKARGDGVGLVAALIPELGHVRLYVPSADLCDVGCKPVSLKKYLEAVESIEIGFDGAVGLVGAP
jgi:hypothetical protein